MLLAILASIALAPVERTLIVLNKFENTASIIDIASGKTRKKVEVGVGPHEVAICPNGRTAAVSIYGNQEPGRSITLIDLKTNTVMKTLDVSPHLRPHGIEWLDADSILFTSEMERKLTQVNAVSGKIEAQYDATQPMPHMLQLSPDKKRLYSTNMGTGTASAFSMPSGKLLGVVKCGDKAEGLEVSRDGKRLWITNGGVDTVSVIDALSLKKLRDLPTGRRPLRAKLTPDGRRAVVTCFEGGQILVMDAVRFKVLKTIDTAGLGLPLLDRGQQQPAPIGVVINSLGTEAYIACNVARKVLVLDLKKLAITRRIDTGAGPDGMALSP